MRNCWRITKTTVSAAIVSCLAMVGGPQSSQADIIAINFAWDVVEADPTNAYGVTAGDIITGRTRYDTDFLMGDAMASEDFPAGVEFFDITVGTMTFSAFSDIEIGNPGDMVPVFSVDANNVLSSINEIIIPGLGGPLEQPLGIVFNHLAADFGKIIGDNFRVVSAPPTVAILLVGMLALVLLQVSRGGRLRGSQT